MTQRGTGAVVQTTMPWWTADVPAFQPDGPPVIRYAGGVIDIRSGTLQVCPKTWLQRWVPLDLELTSGEWAVTYLSVDSGELGEVVLGVEIRRDTPGDPRWELTTLAGGERSSVPSSGGLLVTDGDVAAVYGPDSAVLEAHEQDMPGRGPVAPEQMDFVRYLLARRLDVDRPGVVQMTADGTRLAAVPPSGVSPPRIPGWRPGLSKVWAEYDGAGACTAVFVDTRPMHGSQGPPEVEEPWAEPVGADVPNTVSGVDVTGAAAPYDVERNFLQDGWADIGIDDHAVTLAGWAQLEGPLVITDPHGTPTADRLDVQVPLGLYPVYLCAGVDCGVGAVLLRVGDGRPVVWEEAPLLPTSDWRGVDTGAYALMSADTYQWMSSDDANRDRVWRERHRHGSGVIGPVGPGRLSFAFNDATLGDLPVDVYVGRDRTGRITAIAMDNEGVLLPETEEEEEQPRSGD